MPQIRISEELHQAIVSKGNGAFVRPGTRKPDESFVITVDGHAWDHITGHQMRSESIEDAIRRLIHSDIGATR